MMPPLLCKLCAGSIGTPQANGQLSAPQHWVWWVPGMGGGS